MSAKNPNARKGDKQAPLNPLSANAALPFNPASPAFDNKLSGAFATVLGKLAGGAETPPVSAGIEKTKGGPGRSDQINKASKPAAGKNFSGHRSGHR